jgi:hypothetical protein
MSLLYPQFPDWCWYVNIAKESNCIALKCRYFNLVHNKEYFSHVLIFVQTSFVNMSLQILKIKIEIKLTRRGATSETETFRSN